MHTRKGAGGKYIAFSGNFGVKMVANTQKMAIFSWKK